MPLRQRQRQPGTPRNLPVTPPRLTTRLHMQASLCLSDKRHTTGSTIMLIATARQLFLRRPALLDSPRTRYTVRLCLSQPSLRSCRHRQRNSTRRCLVLNFTQPLGHQPYRLNQHMIHRMGTILRTISLVRTSQMAAAPRPRRATAHQPHKHPTQPIRRFPSDQTIQLRIRTPS